MANQPEQPQYDAGVYQLEATDPVDGGVGAVSNKPLLNLADRTAYLKQHVDNLENGTTIPPTVAPLNSPAFTGSPTAPTPALGDNSTKISTTAFVQGTVNGISTISVAGGSNVTLTAVQAGQGTLVFTGALTANIAVIVPNTAAKWEVSNQTTGAFTLTVKTAAGTGILVAQGKNTLIWCDGTNVNDSKTDFPSPALTGTPTAPTATSGDNSTTVANTGFVFNATDGMATVNVAGNVDVALTQAQYGCALLNLTGALTGNINLKFPQQTGQWVVANNSTGSFAITGKTTATGTPATVTLPQGSAVIVYSDGTNMYLASAGGQTSLTRTQFTPGAGTTSLTVATGYTAGNLLIEKNGALLEPADFTATNGSTITLTTATVAGDVINVYAFKTFTVANAVQKSGDTMAGPLALFGGDTGTTAAQFDNSTKLATTAFVKAGGFQFPALSGIGFNASQSLSTSQLNGWGQFDSTGLTVTMPALSTVEVGSTFTFLGGSFGGTVKGAGTDQIQNSASSNSNTMTVGPGEILTIVCNGTGAFGYWYVVQDGFGSPSFSSSLVSTGYQKLPSGLIIQWGVSLTNASGQISPTLPISFPTSAFAGFSTVDQGGSYVSVVNSIATSSITATAYQSNTGSAVGSGLAIAWMVLGH